MSIKIRNAVIESTKLGTEDHGVMSAWLFLDYGGSGQGFGGYTLDDVPTERSGDFERRPAAYCGAFLAGVLKAVGCPTWEKLPGKPCRVKADFGKVYAIGHYLEDEWFDPAEMFKAMRAEKEVER